MFLNVLKLCFCSSCNKYFVSRKMDKYNDMLTANLRVLIELSGNQILNPVKRLMKRQRLFWDIESCSVQNCVLE